MSESFFFFTEGILDYTFFVLTQQQGGKFFVAFNFAQIGLILTEKFSIISITAFTITITNIIIAVWNTP